MPLSHDSINLDFGTLRQLYFSAYGDGENLTPSRLVSYLFEQINSCKHLNIWIYLLPQGDILKRAQHLEAYSENERKQLPLYGLPYAVKDNVDVASLPTTAACPAFRYIPEKSASLVNRLDDAGAILIGKTNLDQFAAGLVGTRSPYGACKNAFDPLYISGGSSSGSAVAVARGLVSFAIGTDTAGSGRIPAAFNNIVGLKPTRGRVSNKGIVPACQTLDCASIFSLTCQDAWEVLLTIEGNESKVPLSRRPKELNKKVLLKGTPSFRFGIPHQKQLYFFENKEYESLFNQAINRLEELGGQKQKIDYTPFRKAAELLYEGPWVAERYAAIQTLIEEQPETLLPVTRTIIASAQNFSAVDAFQAYYQLQDYIKQISPLWEAIDFLVLPTTGTIYTLEQVEKNPIQLNTNLGFYSNFLNLLDLCAWAVPSGFQKNGIPFGITLIAPAFHEKYLGNFAALYQFKAKTGLGITKSLVPPPRIPSTLLTNVDTMQLAVFGLHLSGQPLNYQLLELDGQFVREGKTAPDYCIYVLDRGNGKEKPAVVRMQNKYSTAVALEIWELPVRNLGTFVKQIPPPLGIGTVTLEDGSQTKGFICEGGDSLLGAKNITKYGGWLGYLNRKKSEKI